jgi:hypothetical protein
MLPGLPESSDRSADIARVVEPRREVVEVRTDDERVVHIVEPVVVVTETAEGGTVATALADLTDVADTAPADGQVLTFSGGQWAPATHADLTAEVSSLDDRIVVLEDRPIVDSPDDIGAAPAGDYATNAALASGLSGRALAVHGHAQADITGLTAALAGKQPAGDYPTTTQMNAGLAARAPQIHTHELGDVNGLAAELAAKADADDLADTDAAVAALDGRLDVLEARPVIDSPDDIGAQPAGSYAAAVHGHAVGDVTGLQAALDGKQPAGSYAAAVHGHVIADTTGLQSALDGKAASGHTHTPPARVVNAPVALTDAATIATDAALGNNFRVTLGGNRTLGAPTNPADGQRCTWLFTQDGTGGRTITLASGAGGFAFGSDVTAFALSAGPGKADMLGAEYHASRDRWLVLATVKGF